MTKKSRLKRPRHPRPDFVRAALDETGLRDACRKRPPYQQNDYVGRISLAKKEETQIRRLHQMLDDRGGNRYMVMKYKPWSTK